MNSDILTLSVPPKPETTSRAIFKLIGATIWAAVAGFSIGGFVSLVSNLIYVVFLFPLGMGFVGGSSVAGTIRTLKLRKTYQLIVISLVTAIAMYASLHYGRYVALQVQMSFKISSGFSEALEHENLAAARILVDYVLEKETGYPGFVGYMLFRANEGVSLGRFYRSSRTNLGPILTWLYWALEFGIILSVTFQIGRKRISDPFCEFCGNWYGTEKHLGGSTAANESLVLDLIKQKDFIELGKLLEENAEVPSVELYYEGCEVCHQGPSSLILRRASLNSKGILQFTDASHTVLSAGDGVRLHDQLRSTRD